MTELTKKYLECVDTWSEYKIFADCQDGSSNMLYMWYNNALEKLGVDENTIFTISYKDDGSYTSVGLTQLDKYIRENYKRKDIESFSKVGGF